VGWVQPQGKVEGLRIPSETAVVYRLGHRAALRWAGVEDVLEGFVGGEGGFLRGQLTVEVEVHLHDETELSRRHGGVMDFARAMVRETNGVLVTVRGVCEHVEVFEGGVDDGHGIVVDKEWAVIRYRQTDGVASIGTIDPQSLTSSPVVLTSPEGVPQPEPK
jgi:hypothetical protein